MRFSEPDLEEHLRRLEVSLLQPAVRADSKKLLELLASDFREFGSSGHVFDRASIINLLAGETIAPTELVFTIDDFRSIQISAGAFLLTYKVSKSPPGTASLRSSVWVHRDDRWQMLFHQGTRIP